MIPRKFVFYLEITDVQYVVHSFIKIWNHCFIALRSNLNIYTVHIITDCKIVKESEKCNIHVIKQVFPLYNKHAHTHACTHTKLTGNLTLADEKLMSVCIIFSISRRHSKNLL